MATKIRLRDRVAHFLMAWPNESLEEFGERMDRAHDGHPTRAGVAMGPKEAMGISAFFCGVNLIMGAIASMPLVLYRRTGDMSRERYREHPLHNLLRARANVYLTAHQWKRTMAGHVVLWGNAFSIMRRDPYRGIVQAVEEILQPGQVTILMDKGTRRLSYEITRGPGEKETLTREGPRFMFHIPGPGFDGRTGFSLLSLARESMGLTAAMEEYGQRYFGQDVHAGGFLQRPKDATKLSPEARERIRESIAASYAGLANKGKYIILEEGMEFIANSLPLEDAQFLTSRTFQVQEVSRWFNLSPARLKELSRATFSNIEQLQIMDLQDCFLPWCSLIEAEINAQLIEPGLQDEAFAEFNMDSLLRADTVARANALAVKRQWGALTGDEWRALDNQNPLPNGAGEKAILPSNYTIADKIGEAPAPAEPKAPTAPQPPAPAPAEPPAARLAIKVERGPRKKRIGAIKRDANGHMIGAEIIEEGDPSPVITEE